MAMPSPPLPTPRPGWLVYRSVVIAVTAVVYLAPAALTALAITAVRGRQAGQRYAYRGFVRLLQRLGPTFVKFGQIMSTRRDALPGGLCDELTVLYDAVRPMTRAQTRRALAAAYGAEDLPFHQADLAIIASGSIASVFHATLSDGTEVALKLQRPGIARRMTMDLALAGRLVRLCERLPKFRGMPVGDLTAYVSQAILGQLDFPREAASLARLRQALADIPDVRVPALVPAASRPLCLAMEFLSGLDARNLEAQPERTRKRLAITLLRAASQMIFGAGYVHCDLHPGNLYISPGRALVILDAGFSVQLSGRVRDKIGEFFRQLSRGNGGRCAEIIIESAAAVRPGADLDGFKNAVTRLVAVKAGPEVPDFAMMPFGNALFDLQREYGLYSEPDFVFPLMSLAIIESTARIICPGLDFREIGRSGPGAIPAAGAAR